MKLILFLASFIGIPTILYSMDNPFIPQDNLAKAARFGTTKEFKDLLDKLPFESGSTESVKNALLAIAQPITYYELPFDANIPQNARQHAYKADLLLSKYGSQLFQKNPTGQIPALLAAKVAAQKDYLPVLARIMLSIPSDSPFFRVSRISRDSTDTLINYFLEMMSIKHLYPPIRTDLHVDLSQMELTNMYEWAEKAKIERLLLPQNLVLKQLSLKQLKGLLEAFLTYDILQEYCAHPEHPTVKALFNAFP